MSIWRYIQSLPGWTQGVLAIGAVVIALAVMGWDDTATDTATQQAPASESRDEQGQREFDVCMAQADGIARTQGEAAAEDHMQGCVDALANGTY